MFTMRSIREGSITIGRVWQPVGEGSGYGIDKGVGRYKNWQGLQGGIPGSNFQVWYVTG